MVRLLSEIKLDAFNDFSEKENTLFQDVLCHTRAIAV